MRNFETIMKLHTLLVLALAAVSALASTPSKFDGASRFALSCMAPQSRSEAVLTAFVRMRPGCAVPAGIETVRRLGPVTVVRATASQLHALEQDPDVVSISFGGKISAANDLSAAATGARAVAEGIDGHAGYTGRGVVAGLFDTGFDFQNPSFKNADGTSRIERVFVYNGAEGECTAYPEAGLIDTLTTEQPADCHGTHVLGTIAGMYRGEISVAADGGGTYTADGGIFAGMAPEASLAVAAGLLYDANIVDGVARIVDHARDTGRPCVVNMSLSDITGPHDGSDDFATAISALTRDAIIVVSSGNYADKNVSISHTFTADSPTIGTSIWPVSWVENYNGAAGVWGDADKPLNLEIQIRDNSEQKLISTLKIPADTAGMVFTTTDYVQRPGRPAGRKILSLSRAYTDSYIAVYPQRAPSGRYGYYISFELNQIRDKKPKYIAPAIVVGGDEGQYADIYLDSRYAHLKSLNAPGFTDGRNDMPVSSMACGEGIISVGAWTGRPTWPSADGRTLEIAPAGYEGGEIAPFSSFGTLRDGRTLPTVAAPGAAVVSCYSTPFVKANPDEKFYGISAFADSEGRTDYWTAMFGTSMSAPVVAGCIAQWLEADPTLTSADVMEIIAATADKDAATEADRVRWGAGRFNAEAGMREVLRRQASVALPGSGDGEVIVSRDGGSLTVSIPGRQGFEATLYNTAGTPAAAARGTSDTLRLDTSGLRPGVYILRAGTHVQKIIIHNR